MKTKALAAGAALLLLALTGCSGGAAASSQGAPTAAATATPTATPTAMPAGSVTPDVTGGSLDDAAAKLQAAGISFDIITSGSTVMDFRKGSGLTVYRTYPEKKEPLPTSHMTLYVEDVKASAAARASEEARESAAAATASASPAYTPVPAFTPSPTPKPKLTVTYSVTSDAPIGDVTVGNTLHWQMGQEQFTNQPATFTKTYQWERFYPEPSDGDLFSVTAQTGDGGSTITCSISVNGHEVAKQTSQGSYSVVMCSN